MNNNDTNDNTSMDKKQPEPSPLAEEANEKKKPSVGRCYHHPSILG
jgi:hypothetical protein